MLTDMPDSLPGVQTNFWFPEHSDLLFPAGAVVRHLSSHASEPRTALKASLESAGRCSCCDNMTQRREVYEDVPAVQVETVVGVHNGGSSTINITALAGSLNNAKAFSQHFQNFTAQVILS